MPERRCNVCKIVKYTSLFHKYNLCNRYKIIAEVKIYLDNAKLANHFNTSIKEIEYILDDDIDDPNKEGGEHGKYDDVMLVYQSAGFFGNSQFNNTETISRYLDE
tara:strand:+ start:605 stop:919 length:315 start_codon:yes stop_codon:yes gene_type:complete